MWCKHPQIPFYAWMYRNFNILQRILQSLSESVRVVNDYADTVFVWSTTTPTLCLRSQWLFQHACIHAMSCMHTCNVMHAYMYPHSQRLRRHGVSVVNVYVARNFRKWNQIKFFVTLSLVFYFSKVLKSTVCQSSQQLRGHTFFREYLRKNEIFLRNRCCLFICSKGGVKSVKDFIWIISLLATFTH